MRNQFIQYAKETYLDLTLGMAELAMKIFEDDLVPVKLVKKEDEEDNK